MSAGGLGFMYSIVHQISVKRWLVVEIAVFIIYLCISTSVFRWYLCIDFVWYICRISKIAYV